MHARFRTQKAEPRNITLNGRFGGGADNERDFNVKQCVRTIHFFLETMA
jgi:hypothetical protein